MQFVLFWWQKVSERHPVANSGITPEKMSRQTEGIFFRKYLVQTTSSRYKQVLNERCQLVMWALSQDISTYFRVWDSWYLPSAQQPPCRNEKKEYKKIQKYKNTIRSATTLSISLAVHLDQVFMLGIRGLSSHFQDSCVTLLDRTAWIASCHLFDTTLVIKWFPCLHSG